MMSVRHVFHDAQVGDGKLAGNRSRGATLLGCFIEPWYIRNSECVVPEPVPDQAVILSNDAWLYVEAALDRCAVTVSWNQDTFAGLIEAKSVVRAFEASPLNAAKAEMNRAMGASIEEARDLP